MPQTRYNERSWAIDLITDINLWHRGKDLIIKRAGGERTIQAATGSLFPDVLLFGDHESGTILQGWELKMPDTAIDDADFIKNAALKANTLGLNSFFLWNVSFAALYIKQADEFIVYKTWNQLSYIKTRAEVEPHKSQIATFLNDILLELNQFLKEGIIKPATIVDSITGDGLTGLILSNESAYANSLKQHANIDPEFEDEVSLWWYVASSEYGKDENKWSVLARSNLVSILNKFVFAHALRHYNQNADLVDKIDSTVNVVEGLNVFEDISSKADFWNIFSKNLGEESIPQVAWTNFINLNLLLRDFSIEKLDHATTSQLLEKLSLRTKRKVAGQFATPMSLARLITRLVIANKNLDVIDPCCGTGTIAKAVYDYKKESEVVNAIETTWASDKFALPLKMATLNLVEPENIGKLLNVFQYDAMKIVPGEEITLHDATNGEPIQTSLPEFNYMVSNLPFVQQKDVGILNPGTININRFIVDSTGDESLRLDSRSDLYAYLPFYLWRGLANGGTLGIIISNSWLSSEFGSNFFAALKRFYDIEVIITSGKGRWFKDAKVVTNILILRKRKDPSVNYPQSIKFVTLRKSVEEIDLSDSIMTVKAMINKNSSLSNELLELHTYTEQYLSEFNGSDLPLSSRFSSLDWLEEVQPKTLKVDAYFKIARGERRGWNELFIPNTPNSIEATFIKPILTSSKYLNGLKVDKNNLVDAFCCDLGEDDLLEQGYRGALGWINKFKNQVNRNGVLLPEVLKKAGTNWYTMAPDSLADIVTSVNPGNRLFFAVFNEPTFVDQRLIRLSLLNRKSNLALLHALMNSILGMFYIEALGFGRGDGVLDLNSTKLNKMSILNPEVLDEEQVLKVIDAFQPLLNRSIKFGLQDEITQSDRVDFDRLVLSLYGIEHLYEDIQKSLLDLNGIRNAVKL